MRRLSLIVAISGRRGLVLLALAVVFGLMVTAPALASTETATVHGTLVDDSVVQKTITGAVVTVAGIAATVDGQGFTASGVPLGQQTIEVRAPRHLAVKKTIEIIAGDNAIDVAVPITVRETMLRFKAASIAKRYAMFHQDMKAHVSYAQYRTFLRRIHHYPERYHRIVAIRTHLKWVLDKRDPPYLHVRQVVWRVTTSWPTGEVTWRKSYFWHKVSGRWGLLFDWREVLSVLKGQALPDAEPACWQSASSQARNRAESA